MSFEALGSALYPMLDAPNMRWHMCWHIGDDGPVFVVKNARISIRYRQEMDLPG